MSKTFRHTPTADHVAKRTAELREQGRDHRSTDVPALYSPSDRQWAAQAAREASRVSA